MEVFLLFLTSANKNTHKANENFTESLSDKIKTVKTKLNKKK